ncbi:MAG: DNA mismatch repair endonuclease MutL [Chloroflexi bacterium]|nr:DNA mismatch repair endonuclease MutL [Chloroflexota bacterium]
MLIQVLPTEVASKIAAGEVVERPASVVKELIENALDAGATRIEIEVRRGGCQLIRVSDDGLGIPEEELELAFQRYATSKLQSADDLHRIATFGFRGEALPSIAAVAHVEAVSRARGASVGAFLSIRGGQVVAQGRRAWAGGVSVTVRNLFYNTPARLKFLRSEVAEGAHIAQVVAQYALAYPEVRFTLRSDGQQTLATTGSGNLAETLAEVYGQENARQLVPIGSGGRVSGFVSLPSLTRANRSQVSLFVNRRWVQSRSLAAAIERAYEALLPSGRHPIAVVFLQLPPEEVDVNVHPTKAEVRFSSERQLYGEVYRAVQEGLRAAVGVPEMSPPPPTPSTAGQPSPMFLPLSMLAPSVARGQPKAPAQAPQPHLPVLRVVGQIGEVFIVAEGPEGLYLIDQHRAHERVLYERFQAEQAGGGIASQALLEPLVLEITPRQGIALSTGLDYLTQLGFGLEQFGASAWLVRSGPAALKLSEVRATLLDLIDGLGEPAEGDWRERLLARLACRSAVKKGQTLSHQEMRALIEQLEATKTPQVCPHGAPAILHLSQEHLERQFARR